MIERVKRRPRPPKPTISILAACDDPALFGPAFRRPETWAAWRAFLAALFGLTMTEAQLATFSECTGRSTPPAGGSNEGWLVCRASRRQDLRARHHRLLSGHHAGLAAIPSTGRKSDGHGGRARPEAGARHHAVRHGLLNGSPLLKPLITSQTRESISLNTQVVIEIHTASMKSTRGYAICAALLDELAFFPTDDSAEPDEEVLAALRPGMAMIPDAMLLCASSPHARRGEFWDAYRRHYAKEGDPVLVWKATTRQMNPLVRQSWVDAEIERDPAKNTSEYLAEFRSDLEAFVNREAVAACVVNGLRERPLQPGIVYTGFCRSERRKRGQRSLGIAHNDASRDTVILDLIRERRAPHSPENVIEEFSKTLKSYNIYSVRSDKYAGQFPAEQFRKFGITLVPSDRNKSEIYLDLLPLINSARIELLDHDRCVNQLCALERKAARFGAKDVVDHPPNSFDDVINAAAGALVNASLPYGSYDATFGCGREDEEDRSEEASAWRVNGLLGHIYRNA